MGEVCGTFGTKCDSLFFYRVDSVKKVRTEGWSDSRGKRQCLSSLFMSSWVILLASVFQSGRHLAWTCLLMRSQSAILQFAEQWPVLIHGLWTLPYAHYPVV